MTSNFEKNLPEAFLRRCIYFHIDFPKNEQLLEIVKKRLKLNDSNESIAQIKERISEFFKIRNNPNIQKKPTTSEYLDYVRILQENNSLDVPLLESMGKTSSKSVKYLSILLKKKEDLDLYTPIMISK